MSNILQQELLSNIAYLMDNDTDADFEIKCADQEWSVHKAIISQASDYFASVCHGTMQENQEGFATIKDFDTDTVQRMISYIYTRNYVVDGQDMERTDHTEDAGVKLSNACPRDINDVLVAHCEVFAIGDYLHMELLKTLATDKFVIAAEKGWQVNGFINVVKAVNKRYGIVDRRLRDALRDYALKHCAEMVKDTSLMTELAELEAGHDLATDMFRQMFHQYSIERALHEEQMQANDDEIAQQNSQIIQLQTDNASLQEQIDANAANTDERIKHLTNVMKNLIHGLKSLPADCPNARCTNEFGRLKFERKDDGQYGKNEGDWKIRCKCNAVLK